MNKQLDKLIKRHKSEVDRAYYSRDFKETTSPFEGRHRYKHRRSWHHYSVTIEDAEKIEKLEDEILDLGDNIEDALDGKSEQEVESFRGKAVIMLSNSKMSNNSEYKLLSRLFSDINGITCSRELSRKLIGYYLRNRRKHRRLSRAYSQKLSYLRGNGNMSVDHMMHEMYMVLGRTLYFSFLEKVRDHIKYATFKFLKAAADFVIGALGGGFFSLGFNNMLQNATSVFAKFLIKIFGITTFSGKLLLAMVLGVLSGIALMFALRALGNLIMGKDSELLELYDKGRVIYKKVKSALKRGLPKSLGTKGIIALALQINNSDVNKESIESILKSLESINKEVTEFLTYNMDPDFEEKIKEASDFVVSVMAKTREDIKMTVSNKSGQKITIPSTIVLKPFGVSVDENTEHGPAGDSKDLPAEILAIALITSPEIQINIKADDSTLTIQFAANSYFKDYAGFEKGEIKDFVVSYLKIYDRDEAKKRLEELIKNIGSITSD